MSHEEGNRRTLRARYVRIGILWWGIPVGAITAFSTFSKMSYGSEGILSMTFVVDLTVHVLVGIIVGSVMGLVFFKLMKPPGSSR